MTTKISNCWIEAKKAERTAKKSGKNNIKVLKIPASMNHGHIFPHYAWYDTETKKYYDFVKSNPKGQEILFKGKVREHSEEAWSRWVRRERTKLIEKFNTAVGLDIGDTWYRCPEDFEVDMDKCESGNLLIIAENDEGELNFGLVRPDTLENTKIDGKNVLKINAFKENEKIIGWRYFNDFFPTERY